MYMYNVYYLTKGIHIYKNQSLNYITNPILQNWAFRFLGIGIAFATSHPEKSDMSSGSFKIIEPSSAAPACRLFFCPSFGYILFKNII